MNFIGDEVPTVGPGTVVTLSKRIVDNNGGARANRAVIYSHYVRGDSTVGLRYVNAPVGDTAEFFPLIWETDIVIEGYDCLVNLMIKLLGPTPAKLFVQYFAD